MKLEWLNKIGGLLPASVRNIVKSISNFVYNHNSYALEGYLSGHRLRGRYFYPGNYEPSITDAFIRLVQPGWVCVDVGAHVGYFTILMAKLVGDQGRVIAMEAHPENAKLVHSNLKINGYLNRAKVENAAINDGTIDHVKLFSGRDSDSSSWNIVGHDDEGRPAEAKIETHAISLDAYFPPGTKLDLIKMDIEGAEAAALRGMRRILGESQPIIIIEFHIAVEGSGWDGRFELFDANYSLFDIDKKIWLNREQNVDMSRHCIAVPESRKAALSSLFVP